MTPEEFLDRMWRERVTAIMRAKSREVALAAMQAAVRAGFRVVEFTMNTPDALGLIAEFARDDSLVVGSTVDRVGVVDLGDTIMVDLDKETHLPVRQVENGGSQHTLFQAWQKAHGDLKKPHRVTVYQDGAMTADYRWEEFKFDVPLDDGLFEEQRPAKETSG